MKNLLCKGQIQKPHEVMKQCIELEPVTYKFFSPELKTTFKLISSFLRERSSFFSDRQTYL